MTVRDYPFLTQQQINLINLIKAVSQQKKQDKLKCKKNIAI